MEALNSTNSDEHGERDLNETEVQRSRLSSWKQGCEVQVSFKARIVVKGFSPRPGEDFFATFSPVVRHAALRLVVSVAIAKN